MKDVVVTKENIGDIATQINRFFRQHEHVVVTHDFDCGINGKFDKYAHKAYSKCVCKVDADGICRVYENGAAIGIYIKEGMHIFIDESFLGLRRDGGSTFNYKHLFFLVYPDYAYDVYHDPDDARDELKPNPPSGELKPNPLSGELKFNPPSGYENIYNACENWEDGDALGGIRFYTAINNNYLAAVYMTFFKMAKANFGLVSRFARAACRYITANEKGDFRNHTEMLNHLECKWFDMMFEWLRRTNDNTTKSHTNGYFVITRVIDFKACEVVANSQDVHNFLGLYGRDNCYCDNKVGGRFELHFLQESKSYRAMVNREYYAMPGEHCIVGHPIGGRFGECGKMEEF